MKLHIAKGLSLPDEAVTQTFAILAMRGVGKTHTASVMAEEFCKASLPFRVIEPTGAWWGLRASADGKTEGYPVTILGGDHGDAPLEETSGKLIANLSPEEAPFLVLDLSLLSKSAMRRFVADYAEELYHRNRAPLHVIFDEADAFAPQKPRPDELRMLGAIDEIVRRGRIRGLGCTLVTQRSAVLNKDVLTQTEVLVALRTAHPRDRAPVLEWMRVHATPAQLQEVETTLAGLPKGDAWVMSAGWLELFRRVHIRERETFNSSATPQPGVRRIEPKKLAAVDLVRLQDRMKETIERAKANDPAALRRRIAELEREAARKPAGAPPAPAKVERMEVPVLKDGQVKRLEALGARAEKAVEAFATALREVRPAMLRAIEAVARIRPISIREVAKMPPRPFSAPAPPPAALPSTRCPVAPPAPRRATSNGATAGEEPVGVGNSGLRRMLVALAQRPQGLTNGQLGVRAGVSSRSGTFATYLGRARSQGWVHGRGTLQITEAGLLALGGYDPLPEGQALADYWIRQLGGGAARMLQAMVQVYPGTLTNDELGERAGISSRSGTFATYLGRLRALELVTGRGELRASEELF